MLSRSGAGGGFIGRNFGENPKESWLLEANKGMDYKSGASQENRKLLMERKEMKQADVRLSKQTVTCMV